MSVIILGLSEVLFIVSLTLGLLLILTGIILLIKSKNKLAGSLAVAAGSVLTGLPVLALLWLLITARLPV